MNEKRNNQIQTSTTLARRLHPDELPGRWAKTLEVPPNQQAVAVRGDRIDELKPGKHQFGGPGRRPRPDDIALIRDGLVTLHPAVGGLLSYDDQLLEADFLVQVQVTDPARFYTAVARGREQLTPAELAAMVAGEVQGVLQGIARRYTADVLCQDDAVRGQVAGELRGFVAACLEPMGVEVRSLRFVSFLRAEDAVKRAEALRKLGQRLRESQVRDRLAAIHSQAEFLDTVKQIAHEFGLRDQLRQEEWEMLAGEVWDEALTAPGEAARPNGERVADSLDARLKSLEDQLVARFEELLRKIGYETPEEHARLQAIEETIENLERWITVLRALGMFIIFGTALITFFMPEFFPDDRLPRIITSVAGLMLALLSFASALWLHGQVKAHRHTLRTAGAWQEIGPDQRQAADHLVRAKVAGALQQVESNLDQAWNRAYRGPDKDVAVELRRLRNRVRELQQEIEKGEALAPTPWAGDKVPAEQLQAVLQIEEGLLARSDALAQASQALYRQLVEDSAEDLEPAMQSLESGLQELQTHFTQRTALVTGKEYDKWRCLIRKTNA